jgi:hypothetical protein
VQEPVCGRQALVLASVHYFLKLPGILIIFGNDLAGFLVDRKLARRKQDSCALISLIADVQFEGREVVVHRASIRPGLAKSDRAIGQNADLVTALGWNPPNEADVVTQRASNRKSSLDCIFSSALYKPSEPACLNASSSICRSSAVAYRSMLIVTLKVFPSCVPYPMACA